MSDDQALMGFVQEAQVESAYGTQSAAVYVCITMTGSSTETQVNLSIDKCPDWLIKDQELAAVDEVSPDEAGFLEAMSDR